MKELIEAAEKYKQLVSSGAPYALQEAAWQHISFVACNAIPSISEMVAREEAVRRLIVDLRHDAELLPHRWGNRRRNGER